MKNTIFDKTISVIYPDDFSEMSEEEIKKYFGGDMIRFGVRNTEKHVILSLGKSKKSIMSLFASPKSVLDSANNSLKNNLKDYECLGEFDAEMLEKPAKGIRFSYSANDVDVKQFCEMVVTKHKGSIYVLYCLARLEDRKENEELFKRFKDLLESVK